MPTQEESLDESGGKTSGGAPGWVKVGAICLAWLALGAVLFGATAYLDLDLNLFDWTPGVEPGTVLALGVGLLCVAVVIPLGRITRHTVCTLAAWLVVVALAGFGLYLLPAESLQPDVILGRDRASPFWYRGGRALVLALPALLLLGRLFLGRAAETEAPAP